MVAEELKKYLSSMSKEELLEMCIRLLCEQMNLATKLCTELSKIRR
jgi:ribosomal protein L29